MRKVIAREHVMKIHEKMALSDIGNPKEGLLLSAEEAKYVESFLIQHPGYEGRIPKKSDKNPDSPLRYSVVVVADQQGNKQSYAIYDKSLGQGAYGKVKIYQNILTGESVAAKSIRENPNKPNLKTVLEREIEVLRNIGELHGTYTRKRIIDSQENEVNYLIMNLGFGVPLDMVLFDDSGNKMPELDVFDGTLSKAQQQQHLLNQTDICLETVRECIELHEKGYINRDIKVPNYLWDAKLKKAKLIDQGFAITFQMADEIRKVLQKQSNNENLSDKEQTLLQIANLGTPPYMPPEIWLGEGPSAASDFYALGVVFANVMSMSEQEGAYALREDEDGDIYTDLPGVIGNIISTGKDGELQQIFSEIYNDGPHLSSLPELQIMANLIRGLTHEDAAQRMSALQAYEKLIELKSTLLAKLNHPDNLEFHNIKTELKQHLKEIQDKAKAAVDPAHKLELAKQESVMLHLMELTNLLSSSYPIQDELLKRYQTQLDKANHAVEVKDPAFARNMHLMENAFNKVAQLRNLLETNKENMPPENPNKRRPPPLKTQFDQQSKNMEPLRELHPPKVTTPQLGELPGKKPKV